MGEGLFAKVEDNLILGLEEKADSIGGGSGDGEDEGAKETKAYDVVWARHG